MPSPWSPDTYIKAYRFAAKAHRWQFFPGTLSPYVMHLSFVAMEIMTASASGEAFDVDLAIQCALLHDVLEDTPRHYDDLLTEFGDAVAQGVLALTIDKKLPKPEQMPECLPRIKQQPREISMVKLADRISNLQPPPPNWSRSRIRDYHRESKLILDALRGSSPFLAGRLLVKIEEYAAYTQE